MKFFKFYEKLTLIDFLVYSIKFILAKRFKIDLKWLNVGPQ